MARFMVFGLRSNGDDVIVNVEQILWIGAHYVVADEDFQATLHMTGGSKIDLCDFWHSMPKRLYVEPDTSTTGEETA